jgi:hypothetical protein
MNSGGGKYSARVQRWELSEPTFPVVLLAMFTSESMASVPAMSGSPSVEFAGAFGFTGFAHSRYSLLLGLGSISIRMFHCELNGLCRSANFRQASGKQIQRADHRDRVHMQ